VPFLIRSRRVRRYLVGLINHLIYLRPLFYSSKTFLFGTALMSTSSRKKAPYNPCVFFLIVIGNLSDNGLTSTPLSLSTRASSPARLRSWLLPVKNVMLRPSLPPRPIPPRTIQSIDYTQGEG
jgi:hypothetical protein